MPMSEDQLFTFIEAIDRGLSTKGLSDDLGRNLEQLTKELSRLSKTEVINLTKEIAKNAERADRLATALDAFKAGLIKVQGKGSKAPASREKGPGGKGPQYTAAEMIKQFTRIQNYLGKSVESLARSQKKSVEQTTTLTNRMKGKGLPFDPRKLYQGAMKKGTISQESVDLLTRALGKLPKSHRVSLGAPSSRGGRRGGYHALVEQGLAGNVMHMYDVGRRAAEKLSEREYGTLRKDPKASEALMFAGGIHDMFKYQQVGGGLKYDPSHGYKAAQVLQEEFSKELAEYYGEDLAAQIIDAVKMHHFTYTKPEVEKKLQKRREAGLTGKKLWEGIVPKGESAGDLLGTVDQFIMAREMGKPGPDISSTVGREWQQILDEADLATLNQLKERQKGLVVRAIKEADIAGTKDVHHIPEPEMMMNLLDAFGLADQFALDKFKELSRGKQEILTEFLAKQLSRTFEGGEGNIDKLNQIFDEMQAFFPAVVNAFTDPAGLLAVVDDLEEIQDKAFKKEIPVGQLKSVSQQLDSAIESMSLAQMGVLEERYSGLTHYLESLGFDTEMIKKPESALEEFLVKRGDLMKFFEKDMSALDEAYSIRDLKDLTSTIARASGLDPKKITDPNMSIARNMSEKYSNLLSQLELAAEDFLSGEASGQPWAGVDADLMRSLIVEPRTLDPVIQSLKASSDTAKQDLAKKLEHLRFKYMELFDTLRESLTTPKGLVDIQKLFTEVAARSGISRGTRDPVDYASRKAAMAAAAYNPNLLSGQARKLGLVPPGGRSREVEKLNYETLKAGKDIFVLEDRLKTLGDFKSQLPRDIVPLTWKDEVQNLIDTFKQSGVAAKEAVDKHTALTDILLKEAKEAGFLAGARAEEDPTKLDTTLATTLEVQKRIAEARSVFEEHGRYQAKDPTFQSVLGSTPEQAGAELAKLEQNINSLRMATGPYTQEQIRISREVEKQVRVLKEENNHRRNNVRFAQEQLKASKELQRAKERELASDQKRLSLSRSGFRGGYGGGGGGYQSMPVMMGGGGQAGWMARQFMWQLAGPVIGTTSFYNVVKQATDAVTQQEVALINLRRVYGGLESDIYTLGKSMTSLAVDFGSIADQVGAVQEMWAKAGRDTVAEIEKLSEVTLLALNTADIKNAEDAVRYLNSSLMQMNLSWEEAGTLLDSWNKTADKFPAATEDFAEGYARSASYAKALEMNIHQLNGVISILVERTGRSGGEVGTALRMLLSNIFRPKTIETLESFGIRVYESSRDLNALTTSVDRSATAFRPFMDILTDMSKKYKDLSAAGASADVVALTSSLGESRRRNYAIALLDAWDRVSDVVSESENSMGYSAKKMDMTMESLSFKGRQLKAAFQGAAITMGEAGVVSVMKELTETGTDVLTFFNNLEPGVKEAVSWFIILTGVLGTLNQVLHSTKGAGLSLSILQQFAGSQGLINKIATGITPFVVRGGQDYVKDEAFKEELKLATEPLVMQGKEYNAILREERLLKAQLTEAEATLAAAKRGLTDVGLTEQFVSEQVTTAKQHEAVAAYNNASKNVQETSAKVVNIKATERQVAAEMAAAKARALASAGMTLAIGALVYAITRLATYKKAQEELAKQEKEHIRTLQDETATIKKLVEKEAELKREEAELTKARGTSRESASRLDAVQTELNQTYEELGQILPDVGTHIDEHGKRIGKVTEATWDLIKANERAIEAYLSMKADEAEEKLPGTEAEVEALDEVIDLFVEERDRLMGIMGDKTGEELKGLMVQFFEEREGGLRAVKDMLYKKHGAGELPSAFEIIDRLPTFNQPEGFPIEDALKRVNKIIGDQAIQLGDATKAVEEYKGVIKERDVHEFKKENKGLFDSIEEVADEGAEIRDGLAAMELEASERIEVDYDRLADSLDKYIKGMESGKTESAEFTVAHRRLREELADEFLREKRVDDEDFQLLPDEEKWKQAYANAELRMKDLDGLTKWLEEKEEATYQHMVDRLSKKIAEVDAYEQICNNQIKVIDQMIINLEASLTKSDNLTMTQIDRINSSIMLMKEQKDLLSGILTSMNEDLFNLADAVAQLGENLRTRDVGGGASKDPYEKLDKALRATDHELKMIQGRLELLDETWADYDKSTLYIEQRTSLLKQEQEALREALSQTASELASLNTNQSKHAEKIQELEERYIDLEKQIVANVNALHTLDRAFIDINKERLDDRMKGFEKALADVDLNFELLSAGLKEGEMSFEQAELEAQRYSSILSILRRELLETEHTFALTSKKLNEAKAIFDKMAPEDPNFGNQYRTVRLLTEAYDEYEDQLRDIRKAILDADSTMKDFVASLLETGYEEELKSQTEAIEEQAEKAEDLQDKEIKRLQKLLDLEKRRWAEEDYGKEMDRLRQEEAHLWAQFRRIENDETSWAEKRKAELMHEIREKQREIEEREEAKRREDYESSIEDQIEAEEEAKDEISEGFEEQREAVEKAYDKINRTVDSRAKGIVDIWKKTGVSIVDVLREMIPDISDVALEHAKAYEEGLGLLNPSKGSGEESEPITQVPGEKPGTGYSQQVVPTSSYKIINGSAHMWSKTLGGLLGKSVNYENGKLYIGGKDLGAEGISHIWEGGQTWVPIRSVANLFGWNTDFKSNKEPIILRKYERGGLAKDGLSLLHEEEMVLPAKYRYTMDALSAIVKMPKPYIPKSVQENVVNNIEVKEALHMEHVYINDEVDLRTLEIQGGRQLKKSLKKRGIRVS